MKTFVIGATWWGEEEIFLRTVKANSKEDAYRSFINEHYQNVFGEDAIWNEAEESIEDCFLHMEVTCGIIGVP